MTELNIQGRGRKTHRALLILCMTLLVLSVTSWCDAQTVKGKSNSEDDAKERSMIDVLRRLGFGVDPETDPSKLLIEAVERNNEKQVVKLLKKGANVDAMRGNPSSGGTSNMSALMFACNLGNTNIVQILLKKGADPNYQDLVVGRTPLWYAVSAKRKDVVRILLENGADPNAKNYVGTTLLMVAKARGNQEIVKLLESKGAKVGGLFAQFPTAENLKTTLKDLANLSSAVFAWSSKNRKKWRGGYRPTWANVKSFLRPANPIVWRDGRDILGNRFLFGTDRDFRRKFGEGSETYLSPKSVEAFRAVSDKDDKSTWGRYLPPELKLKDVVNIPE